MSYTKEEQIQIHKDNIKYLKELLKVVPKSRKASIQRDIDENRKCIRKLSN